VKQESCAREYIETNINAYENNTAEKLNVTMLVDLLNYGARAQMEFKYDTDNLANRNLTESQKEFATGTVETQDRLNKGIGHSVTLLELESNSVMRMVFYKDVLTSNGDNIEDLTATITYTHYYAPDNVAALTITGDLFVEHASTKAGRERIGVQIGVLDIPDGDQIVRCEIKNKDGVVVAWAEDTMNGAANRQIVSDAQQTIYRETLKLMISSKEYFGSRK